MELAPDGAPIVLGTAGAGFPTTPGAFDTTPGGSNDAVVVKLDLPIATGHIVVVQGTIPDDPQDFTFTAPDFQSSSFKLDDDSDSTLSDTRHLDAAVPGTYSVVQEATPSGWYLGQASCDDGSSPAAIVLSANETVTCTFTNSRLYPRPSGATPLRVPLVPAFHVCQLRYANSTHVPPLDNPSCDPAVQASGVLTQSNQGKGQGSARFDVIVGDPNTPGDQADLAVRMNATDVRETAGGADYAGEVLLSSVLRITDKRNGPLGGGAGTTENFEFSLPVNCAPNTDPNIGSTCSLNSTADSMVPGFAREGQRAIHLDHFPSSRRRRRRRHDRASSRWPRLPARVRERGRAHIPEPGRVRALIP